ncbi:MAG: cellulose synthase/poly-beta-1,6-N-acetylglucosamine synthase-like glycosyltransferase [Neolewinella sp.]
MLLDILAAIPVLLALIYFDWQLKNYRFWRQIKKEQAVENTDPLPSIAVLIPFRNEAKNLPSLLKGIQQFDYPKAAFYFIDDHSTDGGAAIVGENAGAKDVEGQGPNIQLLSLSDHLNGRVVMAHKKTALTYAISQSTADIILTIDADCQLPPTLLRDIAAAFAAGNDVVLGPVLITSDDNDFLSGFQALDLAGYQLYTAACVAAGDPTLANGACFAFRRDLFTEVGGYTGVDHLPSGDDVLLLHKLVNHGNVRFGWHQGPAVKTRSVGSWPGLWRQRLRWAGKAGNYVSPNLQFGQALAFLTALGILVALVWGTFDHIFLMAGFIAWVLKAIIDYVLLSDISRHYGEKKWLRWYPFTQLLYPFYLVAIGTAALLGVKTSWKGR